MGEWQRGINADGLTWEAVNLVRQKSPMDLLMAKYWLRMRELNNIRIWKDIGIPEEDQEKLKTYAEQIGLAIFDKPYEQTRFSADSIKIPDEVKQEVKEEESIEDLEAKLKKLKLKQEISQLEKQENIQEEVKQIKVLTTKRKRGVWKRQKLKK